MRGLWQCVDKGQERQQAMPQGIGIAAGKCLILTAKGKAKDIRRVILHNNII
ncbi:MAG: hypothetical protein L7F77_09865 [Candidatus Magnetominusculus sp. LBB02]|nr:hypothetical protein [Candidatus Magnetominusculus sp. LBB02]